MRTIKDLINKEKDKKFLILCTGSTVKEKKKEIDNFIEREKPILVGVNNLSGFWVPDYHIWTNNGRFRTFGKNINSKSTLLLGSNISLKVISRIIGDRDYVILERVDREGVPIDYRDGIIYGYHRTVGCVAITVSYLLGAKEINIIGMDGHTLNSYEDVRDGKKAHHFYDENYTPYSPEIRIKKDNITKGVLQNLRNYGINFNIITPTVFKKFYDGNKLSGGK
jgi:hypothetical protein